MMLSRIANTAGKVVARQHRFFSHNAGHAHVHQPFGLKPLKGAVPEGAGAKDMVAELSYGNPGLVVLFCSLATFAFGAGVHVVTRATTVNSSVEDLMAKA